MRAHRFALPLLALTLATAPLTLAVGTPASAAVAVPPATVTGGSGFTPGLPLYDAAGSSTGASEPSIHVDSKDNVYVSAPAGVPTGGCPFWYVHPDKPGTGGSLYDYRGTIDTDQGSVGGGDCDISSTPASGAFDDVSVTSLSLANLTSNVTTDGGASWQTVANSASQQAFVVDRQWQASDAALGRHYLTVHDSSANIEVSVSTDGGYQYVQNTPAIDPTKNRKALSSGVSISSVDGSNHFGALVVDPTTHHLFIPFLAPVDGDTTFAEHAFFVAEGDPCATVACTPGSPAGPITWTSHLAFSAPVTDNLSNDFPALAMDKAGTLYAAFTGDVQKPANASGSDDYAKSRIFVLHATTPHSAAAWSTPQAVDPGTGNSNVFPWLAAGSAGNVGVAWYSSTLATGSCPGAGSATNNPVSDNCLNVWNVSFAQSNDGNAAAPTWTVNDVSGTVHKGPICNQGLGCASGTRTMLDFFDVAVDSTGRPNIAYASDMRQRDTADVEYTRQCSGTTLIGVALSDTCGTAGGGTTGGGTTGGTGGLPTASCTYPQITDPTGDATQLIVVDSGQPAANQADLDITKAGVVWNDAEQALVATIDLGDLSAPPASSENLRFDFKLNGVTYEISAQRDNTGATFFDWAEPGLGASSIGSLNGSFDTTKNEITVTLPASTYAAARPNLAPLGVGSVISGLSVLSQRVGVVVTATADSAAAAGSCVYTAGAADAAAVTPEVPVAALLPLSALALFGFVQYRRRKQSVLA